MVRYRNPHRIAEQASARLRSSAELHQGQEPAQGLLVVTLWLVHRTHSRSHGTQPRHRSSAFRRQDRDKMMAKILKEAPIQDVLVLKTHHQKTTSSVQVITEESTRNWDQSASKDRKSMLVEPAPHRSKARHQRYSLKTTKDMEII